jgi:hypothetical protein
METHSHYSRVVPNSHSYISLVNILYQHEYSPEELTREHLIIGLVNTLERGGEFKFKPELQRQSGGTKHYFTSLDQLIQYLKYIDEWSLDKTIKIINDTLYMGYDLVFKEIKERDMKREEVYKLIDGERDYQESRWNADSTETAGNHSRPEEWLVYMQDYLTEAMHIATRTEEPNSTILVMENIRKITAMGVAAMEQITTKTRKI